jgi:predicted PurR-regulated permease PerM
MANRATPNTSCRAPMARPCHQSTPRGLRRPHTREAVLMPEERLVRVTPRTVLMVVGLLLGIALALWVVWISRRVVAWVLISLFLAMALDPGVQALQRRGLSARLAAAACVYVAVLLVIALLAALFVPTVVSQLGDLGKAAPGYVQDLTHGRGPLGFLETKYHVVERLREATSAKGGGGLLSSAGTALAVTKGVITVIVAIVTIAFMTFFMLLEGPAWTQRILGLVPEDVRPRWQAVANEIYRTVGGYVTGNLLISVIAGTAATIVLLILGVPFAVALGVLVAVLDLIPLAGATLAAIIVSLVAFLDSTTSGVITVVFFVVYQQLENHLLQPVVYGRTVQLSPLVVLISILIGAEVAGILGALGAIPIAGAFQVIITDALAHRRSRVHTPTTAHAA